jgi:hypothetical protein
LLYFGGKIPYGYTKGPLGLVQNSAEQKVIAKVMELFKQEFSLRSISAALASEGILSRQGKPFLPVQLARIIEKARN